MHTSHSSTRERQKWLNPHTAFAQIEDDTAAVL
jgi:hypothetical protein